MSNENKDSVEIPTVPMEQDGNENVVLEDSVNGPIEENVPMEEGDGMEQNPNADDQPSNNFNKELLQLRKKAQIIIINEPKWRAMTYEMKSKFIRHNREARRIQKENSRWNKNVRAYNGKPERKEKSKPTIIVNNYNHGTWHNPTNY